MDALSIPLCVVLLLGVLQLTAGQLLKCIQCTHIQWNPQLRFTGSDNIYRMLTNKFNLPCTLDNPYDQNQFQRLQQYQLEMGFGNIPTSAGIGETICPSFTDYNRCQYIRGLVVVQLSNNDQYITLNMTVRDCIQPSEYMDNYCYERNTQLGYQHIINFFQDRLSFLGGIKVESFLGQQCYCYTDMCRPVIAGSVQHLATVAILVLSVVLAMLLTSPDLVLLF